jgi:Calcineurin-like phosphoesterase
VVIRAQVRLLLLAALCCTAVTALLPRAAIADPVVYAAGDIACDPADPSYNGGNGTATACREMATADLLSAGGFDAVLALGDLQYGPAALADFMQAYDPSWGRVKSATYPIVGNHEGTTATSADGYCAYFGAAAHCNSSGFQGGAAFYSFNLGSWHIVMLNSNCDAAGGCDVGSPQYQWLASDLAANRTGCTLAAWHHPRWTSDGPNAFMQPIWQLLYANGADLVLSGHTHYYERFAPLDGNGNVNPTDGMREFVVGTGGVNFAIFGGGPALGSEVRENTSFGVLRLVLHPRGYDWNFIPVTGSAFADSGSQACRGPMPDITPPTPPGALSATAKSPTRVDLSWVASADDVGVSRYEVWRGPATGAMAAVASTAGVGFVDMGVSAGQHYRYQVRAIDAAGNASAMSNVGVVATPALHRRGALLAHYRLKSASARRALARGRIRIAARRWAPTVIDVRVGGRLAAARTVRTKRAVTLKLASWSKQRRYRHRAVTVTIRRPAA